MRNGSLKMKISNEKYQNYIKNINNDAKLAEVKSEVNALMHGRPLFKA